MSGVRTRATTTPDLQRALKLVVLLGVVSLCADMTYEGARSIAGPFLAILGASGTAVGLVAGSGELAGYALRLWSGRQADRTHRYWTITIVGYAVNLLAAPLLALAGHWSTAACSWSWNASASIASSSGPPLGAVQRPRPTVLPIPHG